MIEFHCKRCNQKTKAQDELSGKRVKCPRCKNIVVVPKAEKVGPVASQNNFSGPKISTKHSDLDPALFDIPQKSETANRPSSQDGVTDKTFEALQKLEEKSGTDNTEQIGQRWLPCFIDIFFYLLNLSGTYIGIYIGKFPVLNKCLYNRVIKRISQLFYL